MWPAAALRQGKAAEAEVRSEAPGLLVAELQAAGSVRGGSRRARLKSSVQELRCNS